ncbi:MAG: histidinol dehydrogenase [Steroidobacteraceae bacterium]
MTIVTEPSDAGGAAGKPVSFHDLTSSAGVPPALLTRSVTDLGSFCERAQPIVDAVRREGDAALLRFARLHDGVTAAHMSIRTPQAEFADALREVPADVTRAIKHAIDNIRRFHEAQKPAEMSLKEIEPGVWAGDRYVPIDSVACYVPRGKGSFPSVLNMTAIPALVAGVPRAIVITPPRPDGRVDPGTLVAAQHAGITEVYKCGGAQGVAAVAYGTESVPKCLKIVGPGSPWVLAAKHLLSSVIDPGIPAGPSESIVMADETADGTLAALDLLIESEHGPDSCAYLVTESRRVAAQALEALPAYWRQMDPQRAEFSRRVLTGAAGGIIVTRDIAAAIDFVNEFAPEHLELLVAEPMAVLGRIRNAGEVLLGKYTPLTLANYLLGINAVLPTGGHARTISPLSVFDFMKRISVGQVTESGYERLAADAGILATYEGFDAHARAVSPVRRGLLGR